MGRKAKRPLNSAAVAAADDQFYAAHPEMAPNGQRRPISSSDPASMRSEWMDYYVANGGELESDPPRSTLPPTQPTTPVQPCPLDKGDLVVIVTLATDGRPVVGALVEISGPESHATYTDENGSVELFDLQVGSYTITATDNALEAEEVVALRAATTNISNLGLQPYTVRDVQWIDTEVYCGDEARLEAVFLGYPPNSAASVEILHPTNGNVISTISATLNGGRIDANWVAKAQSSNWRTDRILFRISVPSIAIVASSTNELVFRQRPTSSWTLLNVAHPSNGGYAPSHEKHDARLEQNRVHYNLKLRTFGDPFGSTKQNAAKTLIENVWNNGFSNKKFHRTRCQRGSACDCSYDCCKADFRMDVNFVSSGEHVALEIHATTPPARPHRSSMNGDGGEWGDPALTPATTYPHEVGHVLGQADEYPTGATDPTGVQPRNPPAADRNLMSTPGNTRLLNRHYRWVLKFLNDNSGGDPYEIIP